MHRNADWESLKERIYCVPEQYYQLNLSSTRSVDQNWRYIHHELLKAIYRTLFQQDYCLTDHIYLGCQLLSNVLSIRNKRVYNCSKCFHRSSDWLRYKNLQHEVRHQLKSQQRTYFENLSTSSDSTSYIKCFWKYIISRKHDNTGIGSLQSSSGTITDPFKKAELLNEQFQSAFTTSDPHPSHAKDNSLYPIIPEIHITTPKLL